MLRASLSSFRSLLGRRAMPAMPAVGRSTPAGQRWITYRLISTGSSRWLGTGSTSSLQGTRRMLGSASAWTKTRPLPSWFSRRAFRSSTPRRSQGSSGGTAEPQSLSARFRKLSREYGWAAVGVYLGLTVLDLPLCFLLVRQLGTERIAEAEHFVVSHVQTVIPERLKDWWRDYRQAQKAAKEESEGKKETGDGVEMVGWGVKEAEERNQAEASLATQLALAYAIHKSFIFVRVPLAAAITPKVVKVLRSWGWQIGKRRPKVSKP